MIYRKRTALGWIKTGAWLILFSACGRPVFSQNETLSLNDLRKLGKQFYDSDQSFLSYVYNVSYFSLSRDSAERLKAGLEALDIAVQTHHLSESRYMVGVLASAFPEAKEEVIYRYGYGLLVSGQWAESDLFLRRIEDHAAYRSQVAFMRACTRIYANDPDTAAALLAKIDSNGFVQMHEARLIQRSLGLRGETPTKTTWIAVPLSMLVPGAGQAYTGLYFDAIQNFGFNFVSGYAAYASWRYELSRKKPAYALPVLTSLIAGVFYFTNIYNASNSVTKYNLYEQNKFYSGILSQFQIVLADKRLFLNINQRF